MESTLFIKPPKMSIHSRAASTLSDLPAHKSHASTPIHHHRRSAQHFLHFIFYILHPIFYILHSIFYILHLIFYSLHFTSYIPHPNQRLAPDA